MTVSTASRSRKPRQPKAKQGRPSVGIRELKAKASAIVEDVKSRRVTYAVTKHGAVEALIVPADAGERLSGVGGALAARKAVARSARRGKLTRRRRQAPSCHSDRAQRRGDPPQAGAKRPCAGCVVASTIDGGVTAVPPRLEFQSRTCETSPSASFGSNQVDLGGMT